MQLKWIIAGVLIVIVVASVAAYFLFFAPAPTPPPPKIEKIYIGVATCLTGPFAAPASDAVKAIKDYVEYINEQGGLQTKYGKIPVELIIADNEYKPEKTLQILSSWRETYPPFSFILTCGTHVVSAIYSFMEEMKTLYSDPSMAEAWANATKYPWYFLPPSGTYTDHYRAFLIWYKQHFNETRAPRLAITYEPTAFAPLVLPGVLDYARKLGYNVVAQEVVTIGSVEAYAQIERIKNAQPDLLFIILPPTESAVVLKNAAERGLKVDVHGFYYSTYYEPIPRRLGPLAEGIYQAASIVPYKYAIENTQEGKIMLDIHDRKHPDDEHTSLYVYAWAHMKVLFECVKRSIDTYGNATGEAVKKACESLRDFNTGGLTPPITYTDKDHRGTQTLYIWRWQNGEWKKIGEVTLPERLIVTETKITSFEKSVKSLGEWKIGEVTLPERLIVCVRDETLPE